MGMTQMAATASPTIPTKGIKIMKAAIGINHALSAKKTVVLIKGSMAPGTAESVSCKDNQSVSGVQPNHSNTMPNTIVTMTGKNNAKIIRGWHCDLSARQNATPISRLSVAAWSAGDWFGLKTMGLRLFASVVNIAMIDKRMTVQHP